MFFFFGFGFALSLMSPFTKVFPSSVDLPPEKVCSVLTGDRMSTKLRAVPLAYLEFSWPVDEAVRGARVPESRLPGCEAWQLHFLAE